MRRREFITLLGAVSATIARPSLATTRKETPRRIGWLKIQSQAHAPGWLAAFIDGLRELGHNEGLSFVIEARYANGDISKLPALARELVHAQVDLILATSQPAVTAARLATWTVPIVGRMTDDPVAAGAARSLARPEGNLTGIYSLLEEMSGKRVELLHEAVPSMRRVGALLTLTRGATAQWLAQTEIVARRLGIDIHVMNVNSEKDLAGAFVDAAAHRVDGILAFRNPTVVTHDRAVAELANAYKLPSIFDAREFVAVGGLLSYGPNLEEIFRRLASFTDKILKGLTPGQLPIEQPTRFELVVNVRIAQALGLTIPPTLLARADEVIE